MGPFHTRHGNGDLITFRIGLCLIFFSTPVNTADYPPRGLKGPQNATAFAVTGASPYIMP